MPTVAPKGFESMLKSLVSRMFAALGAALLLGAGAAQARAPAGAPPALWAVARAPCRAPGAVGDRRRAHPGLSVRHDPLAARKIQMAAPGARPRGRRLA